MGCWKGECCGEGCHSFWRLQLRIVWKEIQRSWDTSCLGCHDSLVLRLTAWGIFHVLFQPFWEWVYATCYVVLMVQSFVAGTQFCLTWKSTFYMPWCLAKVIHFAWGIRLLWGQVELIPPADCWGGMWNGRINQWALSTGLFFSNL